jgi:hypothetical protein
LREQGVQWIARVDRDVLATLAAESTRLGEALTALAAAAVAVGARLALHVAPWTLIGQFTHGRLVTPASTGVTITLPRSPRAPATGRHRADANTPDTTLPSATAPTKAPPRRPTPPQTPKTRLHRQ